MYNVSCIVNVNVKCIVMLCNVDDVIIGNLANVPDTSGRGGNVRNVHNHISNNFF